MEGTSSRLFCERGAFFNSKCAKRLYNFFFSDSVNFFKKIKKLAPAPAPAPAPTPTPTPSRRFTDTPLILLLFLELANHSDEAMQRPRHFSAFLTRGYAKRRNGFLLGLRYANVSLAHSGVESS